MALVKELKGEITGYTLIDFNGERLYIEGVTRLVSVTESEIKVETAKEIVAVEGEGLSLSEMDDGSVTIAGKIRQLRKERKEKR